MAEKRAAPKRFCGRRGGILNNHGNLKGRLADFAKLAATVGGATIVGKLFVKSGFPDTNIVVIYIFAVLLTARFTRGYLYGIMSSVISLLCFNYFFTAPYHTLAVNDPSYMITFCVMLITALITGAITAKEKMMTEEATQKGMESRTLYMLSGKLSDAADIESVIKAAAESLSALLKVNVGCAYVGNRAKPVYIQQVGDEQIHRNIDNAEELRIKLSDLRTEYMTDGENRIFPVNGQNGLLGVVTIDKKISSDELSLNKKLIHSMIDNISLALERIEITVERARDRQRMERERERANLLRAISHDLRTPLSGIMGSAEMLMDMTDKDDSRQKILKGIYRDADWLKSLVENILSLTRLQDGKILLHKENEALEEVIASAVAHIEKVYPDREIQVEIPDEFKTVPMDARLIEQVIANLLDNAVKHTLPSGKITVSVEYLANAVQVSVKDEGEGIAEEDIDNLFRIFYTSKTRPADVKKGIGLGLTICQTVVNAHGGTIIGRNRKDRKGAEFVFTLPM